MIDKPMAQPLLLATRNLHKTFEVRALLGPEWKVSDLLGKPDLPAVEETGCTFADNAELKALAASRYAPQGWVLADDSGLEVDALDGAPGVYSARYAGPDASDEDNRLHLADELRSKIGPGWDRPQRARFRCCIALAWGGELAKQFDGTVEGTIVHPARGTSGFGYDSLFVPAGYQQTFAELPAEVKNTLSHRAKAIARAAEFLRAVTS
jgi:XTP/dITP diphosphohydrolase